jgi:thiol-disulfide isomerase/thioredoxin
MKRWIPNIVILAGILLSHAVAAQIKQTSIKLKTDLDIPYVIFFRSDAYGLTTTSDTVQRSREGIINYTVSVSEPETIVMSAGKGKYESVKLWITPGGGITIDLQNDIKFTGPDAEFADYFAADKIFWIKIYNEFRQRNPGFDKTGKHFTDEYFVIQDSITNQRIDFLKQFFSKIKNSRKKEFIQALTDEQIYQSLYYKLAFDGCDVEKFKFYQDKYKIERDNAYQFSEMAVFNDGRLLKNYYYRNFVRSFVMETSQLRIKRSGQKWAIEDYVDTAMKVHDELISDYEIALKLKLIFLNSLIEEINRNRKISWAEKVYATINLLNEKSSLKPALRSANGTNALKTGEGLENILYVIKGKLDNIMLDTRFSRGNPAPDFLFYDTAGRTYTLKDFKDKKIYIDIGAAWCGPCIAGIPAWNKFVEENEAKNNVVFISLSLDDTIAQWKTFLNKHAIRGLRLFAGDGFKGSFAKQYNIVAIPHFMLLDEKGRILEYSAPAPGSEAMTSLLVNK